MLQKCFKIFCSFLSIFISISNVIRRKPSFILQTDFINCTLLRSYTTIISYSNLYLLTPPYYDKRSDINCLCTQMICDWKVRFSLRGDSFTWGFPGWIFVCKVITLALSDTASHTMFCKQTTAYKSLGLRQIMYLFLQCKFNIIS